MLLIGVNDNDEIEFYSKIDSGRISHIRRIAFGTKRTFQNPEQFVEAMKKVEATENDYAIVALHAITVSANKPGLFLRSKKSEE